MSPGQNKKSSPFWPSLLRQMAIFLFIVILFIIGTFGYFMNTPSNTIIKGVIINGIDVGGKTREEALLLLNTATKNAEQTFELSTSSAVLNVSSYITFNKEEALAQAYTFGGESSLFQAFFHRLQTLFVEKRVTIPLTIHEETLTKNLTQKFGEQLTPAKNAHLILTFDNLDGKTNLTVIPEHEGTTINNNALVQQIKENISTFSKKSIIIPFKKEVPRITKNDVEMLSSKVDQALSHAPLQLTVKNQTWTVSKHLLADWLDAVPSESAGTKVRLGLDGKKVEKFLVARTTKLTEKPVDAIFEMKDGKVTRFEPAMLGEKIDIDGSLALIESAIFETEAANNAETTITLQTIIAQPTVDNAGSNPYGIKEIIGVGESNFRGSPKNRRQNIATGAASVNGTLIMPGEEFSLLKTLGKIDDTTGYLKELVIKLNKTTPEFGGGLCQIGTTTFRAALAAGLPITERQNHSYRVPYYERDGDGNDIGPGKDATIYDPKPDFKFLNDTGNTILILTKIKGDKLTFTFWGVNDSRTAVQGPVKVYNVVPPPEKKILETTDLPPGETKCTEKPHQGSDAIFTYTVTYPNGEIKKKDFRSHYKPWGEVCLIGIDPKAKPLDNGTPALPSADAAGVAGN